MIQTILSSYKGWSSKQDALSLGGIFILHANYKKLLRNTILLMRITVAGFSCKNEAAPAYTFDLLCRQE